MLSLTPFFTNTYLPAVPSMTSIERQLDHDLARMHRMVNQVSQTQDGIRQCQPNYSFEQNDEQANLEVELPGVAKENVTLDLRKNALVISAKRFKLGATIQVNEASTDSSATETPQAEADGKDVGAKKDDHHKPEQPKPSVVYELKLRVGHKHDTDNIQATMDGDGILKMTIPIKKDTPRVIQIQSTNM